MDSHKSIPANPLIADSMYWKGYIEKVGSGTEDIIEQCREYGLKTPEFYQEEDFKVVIWRKDSNQDGNQDGNQDSNQDGNQDSNQDGNQDGNQDSNQDGNQDSNQDGNQDSNQDSNQDVLLSKGHWDVIIFCSEPHSANLKMILPDAPKSKNQKYVTVKKL